MKGGNGSAMHRHRGNDRPGLLYLEHWNYDSTDRFVSKYNTFFAGKYEKIYVPRGILKAKPDLSACR